MQNNLKKMCYLILIFGLFLSINLNVVNAKNKVDDKWKNDGAMKVLSIGNSFSIDSSEYLYEILNGLGVDHVKIGNLYIGGATIEQHYMNAKSNAKKYSYRINKSGKWVTYTGYSIRRAVLSDDWDYIVLQQSGIYSGLPDSYSELRSLIKIIKKYNSEAKIAWHMTWAWQDDAGNPGYEKYNYNQKEMYDNIVKVVQQNILNIPEIDYIIPVGTAIQNARTSCLSDTFTRDGKHLSLSLGRYMAGVTFACKLTGYNAGTLQYSVPDVTAKEKKVVVESVENAIRKPYVITKSKYTVKPKIESIITYHANGGKGVPEAQKKSTGKAIVLSSVIPTRKGYTFEGWGISKDSVIGVYLPGSVYSKDGNITLYAVWKANTYKIKYYKNYGSGSMKVTSAIYGKNVSLRKNAFSRKGYVFNGWNTRADGTGKKYKNQASVKNLSYKNEATVKLYAQWKPKKYKINYVLNGGKNNNQNPLAYVTSSETFVFAKPTRKGYTFDGWYLDSLFNNKITEVKTGSIGNLTLYAKWSVNQYSVKYYANGGEGKMKITRAMYGKNLILPKNDFTRDGYIFAGWNTKADGSGKSYLDNDKVKSLTSKNKGVVKLYAQWVKE